MKVMYNFTKIGVLGSFFYLKVLGWGYWWADVSLWDAKWGKKPQKSLFSDHLLETLSTLVTTKATQISLC